MTEKKFYNIDTSNAKLQEDILGRWLRVDSSENSLVYDC